MRLRSLSVIPCSRKFKPKSSLNNIIKFKRHTFVHNNSASFQLHISFMFELNLNI